MTLFNASGHLVPLHRFRELLRQGADPSELWRSPEGTHYEIRSALLLAAKSVDGLAYLRALLDASDVDLTIADLQGRTALHLATVYGNVDALRCLLRAGADVHAVDTHGQTALHYACQAVDDKPMRLLLEVGADPNVPNFAGRAALHETLMAYTTWPKPLEDKVALLLAYGAKVDQPGTDRITPLYAAASAGWARLVATLLEAGADPQFHAANGERPVDAVQRQLAVGPGRKATALQATYSVLVAHDRKQLQRVALSSIGAQLPAWKPLERRM